MALDFRPALDFQHDESSLDFQPITPAVADTGEGDGFLAKIKQILVGQPDKVGPYDQYIPEQLSTQEQLRMEEQFSKEHPYIYGAGTAISRFIPKSWEDVKSMATLPRPSEFETKDLPESEHLAESWRGEHGPVEQAASIVGTALQAAPLVHLPFAESPLRPSPADLSLVDRIKQAQAPQAPPEVPPLLARPQEPLAPVTPETPPEKLPATEEKFNRETLKWEPKEDRDFWVDGLDYRQSVINGLARLGVDVTKTDLPSPEQFTNGKDFFYAMREAEAKMRQSGAKAAGFVFQDRGYTPPSEPPPAPEAAAPVTSTELGADATVSSAIDFINKSVEPFNAHSFATDAALTNLRVAMRRYGDKPLNAESIGKINEAVADLPRYLGVEPQPPEAAPPPVTPAQSPEAAVLERRQGILDRKKELEARATNGEQGLEPHLAAVEAELNDTKTNPVVHAPPPTPPVPPEAPVQALGGVPGAGALAAGPPRSGLVPAFRDKATGEVFYGKPGRGHISMSEELPKGRPLESGFAAPDGTFLNAEEAHQFALKEGVSAARIEDGKRKLDALSYGEQKYQPTPTGFAKAEAAAYAPEPYTPEAAAAREATSTKNVVTAAEREARGLPPAEEAAARDFGTVWDESAKDTAAPARLVAALKVEPRALSDMENAHLLRRQIELQTEHDTMTKAVNEASDPAVAAEAKQRLETVRNDLQDVYDVGKAAGTETGRGLNARKMLADQDYALANMEATTRALVNDGKPLSEAQLSEVAKLHERIRTAEDKLSAYESQEIFNQSLRAQPRRPVLSFLDEQAVKARERINARKTRLYADPLGITNVAHLADEAIIGASHIARGVTKFADWSTQMVSEFGDRIKPYLAALFEKSKQQFKAASAGLKKAPMSYAEREARALAGEKKGIITRTEKLKGRTQVVEAGHPFGEFEPLPRRAPRMDPEKARLQFEYQKAKEAFDRGIYESELKKRSRPERILGTAREFLNLPRSLLASTDFSAVRRQGGIYTMIHPFHARHAFRAMLEATKSEQGYFKVMQEIRDRPNAPEYLRYGLELTDIGPVTRAKMEEQFQSRWAEKIPLVSHSQRAYTGFLNRARADWFDLLKDSLAKKGEPLTPKQGKAIANAVNVFTGRGAVSGKWLSALTALNDVFFAPRWRMSRFQTLIGQPLWKNSGARGVIAKEYAKALIGYGSILTLIGWATKNTLHPLEKNPVSTEAGKLRIGNTRVDFMQGLQQPTVFLSRLLSGRTKTQKGEIKKIYGDVPYGQTTVSNVIAQFLRSSLAPVPGAVWNVLEQKNVVGEPVTLPSTVRDLTIPLLGQDIYDAMKQQGVPTATALGLVALFGDSIQTYSPRVSTKEPKREPSISQRIKARHAKATRDRKKAVQGVP